MLAIGRCLTGDNASELLTAIEHKTRARIERIRAGRFPQPDLPTVIEPITPPRPTPVMVATAPLRAIELSPGKVQSETPVLTTAVDAPTPARVMPLAPARVGWQFTTAQDTEDLYREVRDLMGHDVPPGDVETVFRYSLLAAKEKLLTRRTREARIAAAP